MKDVYVVEAARTAVARGGKRSWFMNVRADELSAIVMKELRERIGVGEDWAKQEAIIDDVVWATCPPIKNRAETLDVCAGHYPEVPMVFLELP